MDKKTFLILGGYGTTGKFIAKLLLQETDVQLIITGRNLEKAQATTDELNQKFDGNRVSAQRVDAADIDSLKKAFRQIDFVIVSSSTLTYVENVTKAALMANIDYLDHQASSVNKINTLESMQKDIKQAGRCFITEGGVIPGLPAMLVSYANLYFDHLDIAHIAFLMREKVQPVSEETMTELDEASKHYQPLVFKNGKWLPDTVKQFDFGTKFGMQNCEPLFMEELKALPDTINALTEIGFFLTWFSEPPYYTILMLEAKGWKDDKYLVKQIKLSHESAYFLTAVPVVSCLLQYLDGCIEPGLWYQANIVEPKRMMNDLKRLGILIEN